MKNNVFKNFTECQLKAVEEIKAWLVRASKVDLPPYRQDRAHFQQFSPGDVFIGYHDDAPASIVLRLSNEANASSESIAEKAKIIFLECATPDAISRLSETRLGDEEKRKVCDIFYNLPKNSLSEAIQNYSDASLMQVTTFSRLITDDGKIEICKHLNLNENDVQVLPLQQINTEEQFSKSVRKFLNFCDESKTKKILIVQAHVNPETSNSLVECTRYSILNQVQQHRETTSSPFCIILLLQVPRVFGGFFSGFPGNQWKALHIDELCGDPNKMTLAEWNNKTLHSVLESGNHLLLKQLLFECIPKAASMAFKSNELLASRILHCIEVMKNCIAHDQVRTQVLSFFISLECGMQVCPSTVPKLTKVSGKQMDFS